MLAERVALASVRRWSHARARCLHRTATHCQSTIGREAAVTSTHPNNHAGLTRPLLPTDALRCLLTELVCRTPAPTVVSRLVAAVQGNTCCLDPHICLQLVARRTWADLAAAVALSREGDGGGMGHDCTSAVAVQLAPLERTLLACLWGQLSMHVTEAPQQTSVSTAQDGRAGDETVGRLYTPSPFPRDQLPWTCATLLRFVSTASLPGCEVELLTRTLVTTTVGPALMRFFSTHASDPTGRADHCPGLWATAAIAVVREALVWWELLLRCSPHLPVHVRDGVCQRAWAALDAVASEARRRAAAVARCGPPALGSTNASNVAFLLAVDVLVARLPVLVTDTAGDAPLMPVLMGMVDSTLALAGADAGASIGAARARLLRRLVLECTVAPAWAAAVCTLVKNHLLLLPQPPGPAEPTAGSSLDELQWVAETSIVEWYRQQSDSMESEACVCRALAAAMTARLQAGLVHIARVDASTSAHSVDCDRRSVGVGGADSLPCDQPSLSTLLRYVQCWQTWLPCLARKNATRMRQHLEPMLRSLFPDAAGSVAAAHARLLQRLFARCLVDVAAPHVDPLLVLVGIRQLALLVAESGDPLTAEMSSAATDARAGLGSVAEPPSSRAAESAWLLLQPAVLRRLQRQCVSVLLRLRHRPGMHSCYCRAGVRRARGEMDAVDRARFSPYVLVTLPDTIASSSRGSTAADGGPLTEEEKRRWQLLYLPAVVDTWVALGGGPTCGTSSAPFRESIPSHPSHPPSPSETSTRATAGCACASDCVRWAPTYPASVIPFLDDVSTLTFLTSLRSDAYDLLTEVHAAYPRMLATTLHAACVEDLRVSCDLLRDGTHAPARGGGAAGGCCWPLLLSVGGVPVAPTSPAPAAGCLAEFFLWQEARRGLCGSALCEADPSIQRFYREGGARGACDAVLAPTPVLDVLQYSVGARQLDYALSLFQLGSMVALSEQLVRAASLAGRAQARDRAPSGDGGAGGVREYVCASTGLSVPLCSTVSRSRPVLLSSACLSPYSTVTTAAATAMERGGRGVPWVSGTYEEENVQSLWKCVHACFLCFRATLESDMEASCQPTPGSLPARTAPTADDYRRRLHTIALRAREAAGGEQVVADLVMRYTVPFASLLPSALGAGPGCAGAAALSAAQAQRALRIFFLNPTATFTSVSPRLLLQLWQRAAGASRDCAPQTLDALVVWNVAISLAVCLERIETEAAAYVVANASDAFVEGGVAVDGSRENLSSRGTCLLFGGYVESPLELLESLAAALRDSDERREWAAASAPELTPASPAGEDDWDDDGVVSHLFSRASVRFAEVMDRPSTYDAHSLVAALRAVEPREGLRELFCECDDLVRRVADAIDRA